MALATSTSAKALQRSSADKCVYLYDGSLLIGYWTGSAGQVAQVTSPLTSPSVTNLFTTTEDAISLWADNSSGTSSYIWVASSDDDASGAGPAMHLRSGTYTSGGGFSWNTATSIPGTTQADTISCSVTWNGTYLIVFMWDGVSGTDRLSYAYTTDKTGQSGWTNERTLNGGTWSTIVQVAARHSAKLGATVIAYGGNSRMFYGALADGVLGQTTGATASETGTWSSGTTAVGARAVLAVSPSGSSPVLSCGDPKLTRATTGSVTGAFGNGQPRTSGNLLVAVVSATGTTSAATISTPSGWAQQVTVGGGTLATCAIYTKTASGGDTAPAFTSTISGTATMTCTFLELVNANTTTPKDTSGSGTTASSTITTQTVTTSGNISSADDYLVSCFVRERTAATATWTAGTGWWNVANDGTTSSTGHCAIDVKGPGPELNNWAGGGATGFYSFADNYTNFGGPQLVIDEATGDIHCARAMTTGGGPTNSGICYWHGTYSSGTVSWSSVLVIDADGGATTPADIGAAVDGSSTLYVIYTDAATSGNLKYATLVSPFTSVSTGPTVIVAGSGSANQRWPHSPPVSASMGGLGTALPVLYTNTFSSPYPVNLDTSVTLPGGAVSGSAALTGSGSLAAAGQYAGAAALTGTGSLTAAGKLAGGAALAGTGALGTAAAVGTSALLAGAGTLSASPQLAAAAALSGTGTLAAASQLAASAGLAGSGSLSASPQFTPGAALSGTGSLGLQVGLPAALTGTGTLAAGGTLTTAASLSGTGSLAAGPQLAAAAALSGSGTLLAAGRLAGGAALTGTGSLAAAGQYAGAAVFTGTGSLTAGGQFAVAAALSGTGTLAAAGLLPEGAALAGLGTFTGAGQLAGAAGLSGAGSLRLGVGVGAALSGSGTLSAAAQLAQLAVLLGTGSLTAGSQFSGTAGLSGAGVLTASAQLSQSAALSGSGTLSAAGQFADGASLSGTGSLVLQVGLGAALTGTGTLTATYGGFIGASAMAGTGSLSAGPAMAGAAALSGSGTLAAGTQFAAAASLSGTGSLSAQAGASAAVALSGSGTLAAAGQFTAALSGTGTLAAGTQAPAGAVLSGSGSLAAAGFLSLAAVLSGTGMLSVTGQQPGSAALSGAGSLAAAGSLPAAVALAGTASLAVSAAQAGAAALSGSGSLSAQWAVAGAALAALSGTGSLAAAYGRVYAAAAALSGSGSLLAQGRTLTGVLGTCLAVDYLAYTLAAADKLAYSAAAASRPAYSAQAAHWPAYAVSPADKLAYYGGADD